MTARRLAIVGSRDYPNLDAVRQYVREQHPATVIISGGARGVDRTAVEEAKRLGMPVEVYPADWERYGKRAGFLRNETIVSKATEVTAFWDGRSSGTQHTIRLARAAGVPVQVIQET